MMSNSSFRRYLNSVKVQTLFLVSYLAMIRIPGTKESYACCEAEIKVEEH